MRADQISAVFKTLRDLEALRQVQSFLRDWDASSAKDWEGLEACVRDAVKQKAIPIEEFLAFYQGLRIGGHKMIALYPADDGLKAQLRDLAKRRPDSLYGDSFPAPVTAEALKGAPKEPKFAAATSTDAGTALVFCSPRVSHDRQELSHSDLRQAIREEYAGARIVAERELLFQAYDVVFVPKDSGYVHVRLDRPHKGIVEDAETLRGKLEHAVERMVRGGGGPRLVEPVNVFPAIKPLYSDPTEGRVCELHFYVTTGARHTEKYRRSRTADIRTEPFHEAGVKAVTDIIPFLLGIIWERERDPAGAVQKQGKKVTKQTYDVEALLPGAYRCVSHGIPLRLFQIVKFPDESDIDFVIERIANQL